MEIQNSFVPLLRKCLRLGLLFIPVIILVVNDYNIAEAAAPRCVAVATQGIPGSITFTITVQDPEATLEDLEVLQDENVRVNAPISISGRKSFNSPLKGPNLIRRLRLQSESQV